MIRRRITAGGRFAAAWLGGAAVLAYFNPVLALGWWWCFPAVVFVSIWIWAIYTARRCRFRRPRRW